MTKVLSQVGFFITISCCLQISSSNIISSGIAKVVHVVEDVLHLNSSHCILPEALCSEKVLGTINEIVKTGPNLKEDIAKLEKTDFLAKYKEGQKNEDKNLSLTQLIAKYGYKLQIFTVETEDGYLLPLYRFPGKGDPVLLVQGITCGSVDWFTIGRESCLPCLLADRGYDVWILSNRGTSEESQRHIRYTLPRDADQYWDFSFDELGRYDLPATIDFVLEETGKPKMKYVGFSQGTAIFYVMVSELPEYAEKISLMVSLAPVAFLPNIKNPLFRLVGASPQTLGAILNIIGYNKFNAENPLLKFLTEQICGKEELAVIVCSTLAFSLFGFDYAQVNATQVPVIAAHYPSSFSMKQVIHYGQLVKSGKFRRYDYGPDRNMAVYGSEQPPDYALDKISTPVALYYSRANDLSTVFEDVLLLKGKLPNVVEDYIIPYPTWAHTDYLWAKDVKVLLYDRVMELLQKY
ncbi:alpha/beta hydrolase fold domain-containing protein [Phthorimaea operculella]|nr:alpha/beta hydrolase fold domain-containing protein [Phthorimaea operculella]